MFVRPNNNVRLPSKWEYWRTKKALGVFETVSERTKNCRYSFISDFFSSLVSPWEFFGLQMDDVKIKFRSLLIHLPCFQLVLRVRE